MVNPLIIIKGKEVKIVSFSWPQIKQPYLFGEKVDDTTTKNRFYVALNRSLDKLTIFIAEKVEAKYKRDS